MDTMPRELVGDKNRVEYLILKMIKNAIERSEN